MYVDHPLFGVDHRILAGADMACCLAACGSTAVIWYLEVGWATVAILIWSGLELTRVGPMGLYDHAYSGKGFALPIFRLPARNHVLPRSLSAASRLSSLSKRY